VFPVRGFDKNILDAGQFATASVESLFPLIYLQSGYKTLPLFLRNISLGVFVDGGIASNHFSRDDLLVGAGIELLTGMQVAWGYNANFRISLAWPVRQPDYLDQSGPTLIVQLGKPL
jgi:hemolysin activation/secretion protein